MSKIVNKHQFVEGIIDNIVDKLIGMVNKERKKKNCGRQEMSSVDTEDTEEKLFEFLKQWPFMLSAFHSLVKRLQRRYDHHLISISRKKKT